jgi:hypothetical protein
MPTTATAQQMLDMVAADRQVWMSSLQTSLTSLQNAAGLPYLSWTDFSELTPPTLNAISAIVKPGFATLTLSDLPVMKQAVQDTASMSQMDTAVFEPLKTAVMDLINSGGQNISPTVQAAIFDTGLERQTLIANRALDLVGARIGGRGARYPNSLMAARSAEIVTNLANQQSDTSREIIRTTASLFTATLQQALQSGVAITSTLAEITLKNLTYLLEAQKMVIDKFRTEQETYIREYEATVQARVNLYSDQVRGKLGELEAEKTDKTVQLGVAGLALDKWYREESIKLDRRKALIQQGEEANRIKIESIRSLAAAFMELVKTMASNAVSVVTQKT